MSGTDYTGLGDDFELIPTVNMETRTPVEGLCGNELIYVTKTKVRMALQFLLLHGWRPKSARASRRWCTQIAPDFINRFTFGGVISYFHFQLTSEITVQHV